MYTVNNVLIFAVFQYILGLIYVEMYLGIFCLFFIANNYYYYCYYYYK